MSKADDPESKSAGDLESDNSPNTSPSPRQSSRDDQSVAGVNVDDNAKEDGDEDLSDPSDDQGSGDSIGPPASDLPARLAFVQWRLDELLDQARDCGCGYTFGYHDDSLPRHYNPDCPRDRYETYVDEERNLIETLEDSREASLMAAYRRSLVGDLDSD